MKLVMKKFILGFIAIASFLKLAYPVLALEEGRESLCPEGSTFGPLCNIDSISLGNLIPAFINFLFIMAVIVALIYLIWGGFKWLMSGGDKTGVQTAREHIVAAIVGLVIIFLSYFILNLVIGFFLPGFSLSRFPLPTISNSQPLLACPAGCVDKPGSCTKYIIDTKGDAACRKANNARPYCCTIK